MKLAFCQGRHKITNKNKEYMLGSDKYCGGLEIMQGKNGGGTDGTRLVKFGHLISDGLKGVHYAIFEYV